MVLATISSADALQRAQVDTINNTELCSNDQDVMMAIKVDMLKNTHKAYKPKQKEIRKWYDRKQFHDKDTVTENKLLLFITSEVANRPLRTKSRKVHKSVQQAKTRLN